jgi:hypothetical protein
MGTVRSLTARELDRAAAQDRDRDPVDARRRGSVMSDWGGWDNGHGDDGHKWGWGWGGWDNGDHGDGKDHRWGWGWGGWHGGGKRGD